MNAYDFVVKLIIRCGRRQKCVSISDKQIEDVNHLMKQIELKFSDIEPLFTKYYISYPRLSMLILIELNEDFFVFNFQP